MEDIGSLTKQLLSNRKNRIQVHDQIRNNIRNNQVYSSGNADDSNQVYSDVEQIYEKNQDENMFDANFGDISYIQIPYEIPEQNYHDEEEQNYSIEDDTTTTEENFCSYVLYFIIILICLGYIGYHLGSEKVISIESMNGITMGLLSGLIIVNLLWSSIKNN